MLFCLNALLYAPCAMPAMLFEDIEKSFCPLVTHFKVLLKPLHAFFNIFQGIGVGKP